MGKTRGKGRRKSEKRTFKKSQKKGKQGEEVRRRKPEGEIML